MRIGTIIRATSNDGRTIIAGRYVADIGRSSGSGMDMVIEQSNQVFAYVRPELFDIVDLRAKNENNS